MALEQRLELKLSQKLILTPQLQLSIKLLQLPLLELSQDINQELMNNPLLEETMDREPEEKPETSDMRMEEEPFQELPDDGATPLEKIFGFTTDSYFEERESDGRDLGYFQENAEDVQTFFERNRKKIDLYEHLLWQLRLSHVSEEIL